MKGKRESRSARNRQVAKVFVLLSATAGLIFAVGISSASPAAANPTPANDSEPFPITVPVLAGVVLAAAPGATMPAGERTVSISIKDESGTTVHAQQVEPDAKGNYSAAPPVPAKAGTYQVTVTAPDGRGTAPGSFRAIEPLRLGAQVDSAVVDAAGADEDALSGAQGAERRLTYAGKSCAPGCGQEAKPPM